MYCPKVPTIVRGNIISTIEIPPFNENPQTKIKRKNSDTKVCCLATLLSFTRQAKFVVSEQSWKILSNTLLQLDLQIYYFIKYNHSSITSLYGSKLQCEIDYFLIYLYPYKILYPQWTNCQLSNYLFNNQSLEHIHKFLSLCCILKILNVMA